MERYENLHDVMDVCLLAGEIMLENGAETYRVEDTMSRIAASFGEYNTHSYVTPTGIIFSMEGTSLPKTKLSRIIERTTNLNKVAQVNHISRRISAGDFTIDEAFLSLLEVQKAPAVFSFWLQTMAAALSSGCFVIMFQGGWLDFFPAFIAGGVGYVCSSYLHHWTSIKFFAEFIAAMLIGLAAVLFVHVGIGFDLDKIIIGSVMPLVPGLLITNAVRDLMAGHLVSGLSKGAEAFLTAFAIGSGIAVVLSIF